MAAHDVEREREVQATAWFAVLAHAKRVHDFKRATEAQEALDRLGLLVRFRRKVVPRAE